MNWVLSLNIAPGYQLGRIACWIGKAISVALGMTPLDQLRG